MLFQKIPLYLSIQLIVVVVFMAGFLLYWVEKAVKDGIWHKSVALIIRIVISLLLSLSYWVGVEGFWKPTGNESLLLIFTFLGTLAFLLAYTPKGRYFLKKIPGPVPILLQILRTWQEMILWLIASAGWFPIEGTFAGGNFDAHIGATGLFIAVVFYSKLGPYKLIATAWNVLGILLGILTAIRTVGLINPETNELIFAQFPLIWLPTFLWPMFLGLHIFSLIQIWGDKQPLQKSTKKL